MVLSLECVGLRRYGIDEDTDDVVNTTTGKILSQHSNKGYMYVGLYTDTANVQKMFSVHDLVWAAHKGYFPRKSEGYTIDHIDRNPRNNHIDNLREAKKSEQIDNRKVYEVRKRIKFTLGEDEVLIEYLLKGKTVIVTSEGNDPSKNEKTSELMILDRGTGDREYEPYFRKNIGKNSYPVHCLIAHGFKLPYTHEDGVEYTYDALSSYKDHDVVIDHINGNKKDNSLRNLRVLTKSENLLAARDLGIIPSIRVSVFDPSCTPVTSLRSYASVTEAAEAENVDQGAVSRIIGSTSRVTFLRNRATNERVFFARTDDIENGTFALKETNSQKRVEKIERSTGKRVAIYDNAVEAARAENISKMSILNRCNGKLRRVEEPHSYRWIW